ncbi:hypothetical protein, partial [Escherichia coli]
WLFKLFPTLKRPRYKSTNHILCKQTHFFWLAERKQPMMSTPFYKVRQLASSSGWQLRFEGRSDWLPIAAWANVEMCIDGDTVEIIIPCVASRDGCIEPTDMAAEIREVKHEQ